MYDYLKDSHPICRVTDYDNKTHEIKISWIDVDDGIGISFSYKGKIYELPVDGIGDIPERKELYEFFAICEAEDKTEEYELDMWAKEKEK